MFFQIKQSDVRGSSPKYILFYIGAYLLCNINILILHALAAHEYVISIGNQFYFRSFFGLGTLK